jgi:NAD+ diphosphatase
LLNRAYLFQDNTLLTVDAASEDLFSLGTPLDAIASFSIQLFSIPSLSADIPAALCGDLPPAAPLPQGWRRIPMRSAAALGAGTAEAAALMRAFHLVQWRRESVYCGTCGGKNTDSSSETARVCPRCGRIEYPRIAPAVIVLITKDAPAGEEILLAHNARFKPGMYSLLAGFNEAGETLEQTVAREVAEETGARVTDIRYSVSQPWPFPHSLMTGWTARYAGGALKPDGVEIEDARWFSRAAMPELPPAGSVARKLINEWLGRKEPSQRIVI